MPRLIFQMLAGAVFLLAAAGLPAQACTLSSWSGTSGPQGLSTGTPDTGHRRFEGECGLKVNAEQQARYVEDNSPQGEANYFARFYFYADDLELDGGDWVDLFAAFSGESRPSARVTVRLQQTAEGPALVLRALDGGSMIESSPVPVSEGWHGVTLSWNQSTGPANGQAELSVDGGRRAALAGLDNRDNVIDLARLGAVESRGVQGELYFDSFVSRRKTPTEVLITGDANGDEVLDAADLVTLVKEVNGASLSQGQPDCNADGVVDAGDLDCLADEIISR